MKQFLIILLLMSVSTLTTIAETKSYTLKDLEKIMAGKNLAIKVSELDLKIARLEYKEAGRLENPSFEYERGKATPVEGGEKINIWGYSLGFELPNPVAWIYKRKSEKMGLLIAGNRNLMKRAGIKSRLRTLYYNLQLLMIREELHKSRLKSLEEIAKIARLKADLGETKEIDALRASVEIQKLRTAVFTIEKQRRYTMFKISAFLNGSIPEIFLIKKDFTFVPVDNAQKRIMSLLDTVPEIREKSLEIKEASNDKKAKTAGLIPGIELTGVRGREPDAKIWKVSAGIKIPLFNSGLLGVKKAALKKERAETEKLHALRDVKAELEGLVFRLKSAEKEIRTYSASILKEGRENLRISAALYKAGEIPLIVYLDAQNSWIELEESYYNSITEWKLIKTEIEEITGAEL